MQPYNIESTIMRRCGEYLVMQVPGLAEKRPSLLTGDRAIVSFKWDKSQGMSSLQIMLFFYQSTSIICYTYMINKKLLCYIKFKFLSYLK